jgi:hypothetical protein
MTRRFSYLAILFSILLLAACQAEHHASGPLRQEGYIWQRSWSPAVREAVRRASDFPGLIVLAAEVDLQTGAPRVIRVPLDVQALKAYGKPVGAALRITAFPLRFADEPRAVQRLQALVQDVKAEAKTKGIALSEIQIDYDCPESKLEDYRVLLPALRSAAAPVPLTLTALPTWIRQRKAFRTLIAEADGYVLQLHSLKPPEEDFGDGDILLTRVGPARQWVKEAARFGRTFRVALPTYGYQAAFDSLHRPIGLLAEGPLISFAPGIKVRTARSDPAIMAELIRGWTRDRPAEMTGILWYRLPVEGDRRNWTWPTLRAVMAGRAPRGEARSAVRNPEPGLVEIDLVNGGEAETPWPSWVRIGWQDDTFLAADALADYRLRKESAREVRLERPGRASKASLRPGERRVVAWLRFSAPTEVQVELSR